MNSGPSTQANLVFPATVTLQAPHMPVPSTISMLRLTSMGIPSFLQVRVAGKTRFACVDGPEFNGYDVDFDEAMRRLGQYRSEEAQEKAKYVK